jgi:membrane protein implicated in regulation of membrane protease activity
MIDFENKGKAIFIALIVAAAISEMAAIYAGALANNTMNLVGFTVLSLICAGLAVSVYIAWEQVESEKSKRKEAEKFGARIDPVIETAA